MYTIVHNWSLIICKVLNFLYYEVYVTVNWHTFEKLKEERMINGDLLLR